MGEVAAKADLCEVKTGLEAKIETTAANLKVDIVRWLIVTQIGIAAVIVAAVKFIH